MPDKTCTCRELLARVVALEANLEALHRVLDERDERYKLRATNQDSVVKAAMEASDRALSKAEAAIEKRFDNVNEFRATLADQAALLMPRQEYSVQHQALVDKVDLNENRINQLVTEVAGMAARGLGAKDLWGYLIGVCGIALAALAVYFKSH